MKHSKKKNGKKESDIGVKSRSDFERETQKREHELFNNVTQKEEVENQNQTFNTVREGIDPINRRR